MPNIFNSVGDLRFFNFISNSFPCGVPVNLLYTYSADANFHRWVTSTALPGQSISSSHLYFRFPYSTSEPALATETILSTSSNNTTNQRFYYSNLYAASDGNPGRGDPRAINSGSSRVLYLSNVDAGVAPAWNTGATQVNINAAGNGDLSAVPNFFSFGVKSPTTIAMLTIVSNLASGNTLNLNYSTASISIAGWMHNGIYTAPLQLESQRYYGAYVGHFYQSSPTSLGYQSYEIRGGFDKGISGNFSLPHKYYDIVLQNGEYTPGLFVTDFVFTDDFFVKRGKADNRVLAMGRGNFKLGQVYQITNAFGRSGTETWLCVCSLMPTTYSTATWGLGADTNLDRFKYWKPGEYDYLLMRVYTEAD